MLKESNWWTERYDTLKNDKSKLETEARIMENRLEDFLNQYLMQENQ